MNVLFHISGSQVAGISVHRHAVGIHAGAEIAPAHKIHRLDDAGRTGTFRGLLQVILNAPVLPVQDIAAYSAWSEHKATEMPDGHVFRVDLLSDRDVQNYSHGLICSTQLFNEVREPGDQKAVFAGSLQSCEVCVPLRSNHD